jgi:hypothetical protein
VRHDERVRAGTAASDRGPDRVLDPLANERVAVGHKPRAAGLGAPEERDGRPHAGLGGGLRPADFGQLGLALDAAAGLE